MSREPDRSERVTIALFILTLIGVLLLSFDGHCQTRSPPSTDIGSQLGRLQSAVEANTQATNALRGEVAELWKKGPVFRADLDKVTEALAAERRARIARDEEAARERERDRSDLATAKAYMTGALAVLLGLVGWLAKGFFVEIRRRRRDEDEGD